MVLQTVLRTAWPRAGLSGRQSQGIRSAGMFIQLGAEAVEGWLARENTKGHVRRMLAVFHRWEKHKAGVLSRGAVYTMLQTLSHMLMTEITLDCGCPAGAPEERAYALPPIMLARPLRCGLLIYTVNGARRQAKYPLRSGGRRPVRHGAEARPAPLERYPTAIPCARTTIRSTIRIAARRTARPAMAASSSRKLSARRATSSLNTLP